MMVCRAMKIPGKSQIRGACDRNFASIQGVSQTRQSNEKGNEDSELDFLHLDTYFPWPERSVCKKECKGMPGDDDSDLLTEERAHERLE
jgi:hypothetical protein